MVVRVGQCRGAAQWRCVHPSAGARTGERDYGGTILLRVAHRSTSAVARSVRCAVRLYRGAVQRRRVHPSMSARTGERIRGGAVAGRVAERGAARREEVRMNPRVHARAPTAFCSARIHAWPLDADGRLMLNGPSHGPGGTQLSWSRPTTRDSAWSALCASRPTSHFCFRAGSRPDARNAPCASGPTGRFCFRAGFEL
jgi:hypothetical protein